MNTFGRNYTIQVAYLFLRVSEASLAIKKKKMHHIFALK